MQKLSKDEIIELRARAMVKHSTGTQDPDKLVPMPRGEMGFIPLWKSYEHLAKATIEADEKAGVLMLVDDDITQDADIMADNSKKSGEVFRVLLEPYGENWHIDINAATDLIVFDYKIIQRNNTPVYQCQKKVKNT